MTTGDYDKRRLIEWLRAETARATGRRYQIDFDAWSGLRSHGDAGSKPAFGLEPLHITRVSEVSQPVHERGVGSP